MPVVSAGSYQICPPTPPLLAVAVGNQLVLDGFDGDDLEGPVKFSFHVVNGQGVDGGIAIAVNGGALALTLPRRHYYTGTASGTYDDPSGGGASPGGLAACPANSVLDIEVTFLATRTGTGARVLLFRGTTSAGVVIEGSYVIANTTTKITRVTLTTNVANTIGAGSSAYATRV